MRLLTFGVTRDIIGESEIQIELIPQMRIGDLKSQLFERYPKLMKLNSLAIALNETYAADEEVLKEEDVVALIPPVSGG
jgi:sulfur-carrier protein